LPDNYLKSEITKTLGLPTVKYCAEQLHLSANYFGDLIKKETGKSAQEHIQLKLINIAKGLGNSTSLTERKLSRTNILMIKNCRKDFGGSSSNYPIDTDCN
jgi:YesN/AraC family two-component response regulator